MFRVYPTEHLTIEKGFENETCKNTYVMIDL